MRNSMGGRRSDGSNTFLWIFHSKEDYNLRHNDWGVNFTNRFTTHWDNFTNIFARLFRTKVSRKAFFVLRIKVCTFFGAKISAQKPHVICWWNWLKGFISLTFLRGFFVQMFCTKLFLFLHFRFDLFLAQMCTFLSSFFVRKSNKQLFCDKVKVKFF